MDDSNDTVKIGDLGIAKSINDSRQLMITKVGTPYYMAPEMELDGKYTKSADVYAFGCVAFATLALRIPFTAKNHEDLSKQKLNEKFRKLP